MAGFDLNCMGSIGVVACWTWLGTEKLGYIMGCVH